MFERIILSEKLEDNRAAAEWGMKQAELIRKGEEITQKLTEKYTSIILARAAEEPFCSNCSKENMFQLSRKIPQMENTGGITHQMEPGI